MVEFLSTSNGSQMTARHSPARPLVDGYSDLERVAVDYYAEHQLEPAHETEKLVRNLRVLLGPEIGNRRIAVIGCGPKPIMVRELIRRGADAIGIEPVVGFTERAREYLDDPARVLLGSAESLPVEDATLDVVVLETVLEHVESISKTLNECFRTLKPSGVLYVVTTNRLALGKNGEYRVRLFNWLPRLVQEGYVFLQQHYRPELANYSSRPAVHWFTFADLCAHGRQAGFSRFYSLIDLLDESSPAVQKSRLRRIALPLVKYNPWFRALALTQYGAAIFMLKRRD